MQGTGLLCSRPLIEVARILVQKRGEESAADHDRRGLVGIDGAKSLAETLGTPNVSGAPAACPAPAIAATPAAVNGSLMARKARSNLSFAWRVAGLGAYTAKKLGMTPNPRCFSPTFTC